MTLRAVEAPPRRPRMPRALVLVLLVPALTVLSACNSNAGNSTRAAGGGQPAASGSTIDFSEVQSAFQRLYDQAIEKPTSDLLLTAAWKGLIGEARKEGLKAQIPDPVFRGDPRGDSSAFMTAAGRLIAAGTLPLDTVQLSYAAVDAMARSLNDSHTTFLPQDAFNRYNRREAGNLGTSTGFTLEQTRTHPPVVLEVVPNSAAVAAGLHAGDTVTDVNGRPALSFDNHALARALEGPDGTKLVLGIRRAGSARAQRLTLVRRTVPLDIVAGKVLPGNVGYIRIREFPGQTFVIRQVQQALDDFIFAHTQGVIVDLRGDPGGSLTVLQTVTGAFVSQSPIAFTDGRDNVPHALPRMGPFNLHQRVVVLVDAGSASSSEILAAAVQEYGDGIVVGVRTCGCLLGALIFPLADGKSGLEVGVERVLTPVQKQVVEGAGLTPDIAVEPDPRILGQGRDPQLEAGLEALGVDVATAQSVTAAVVQSKS